MLHNDPPEEIVANAKRYRDDAVRQLDEINAGKSAEVLVGKTKEEAIRILRENIAIYGDVIGRYGGRDNAHRS